jgi:hypothetical protein
MLRTYIFKMIRIKLVILSLLITFILTGIVNEMEQTANFLKGEIAAMVEESATYEEILCNPAPENCKGKHKVCGLWDPSHVLCIKYPCGETFDNPCVACATKHIVSYIEQPCESVNPISLIEDKNDEVGKIMKDEAIIKELEIVNISTVDDDSKIKIYCTAERPEYCREEWDPVCGYYYSWGKKKGKHALYSNDCFACADHYVEFYIKGECSDMLQSLGISSTGDNLQSYIYQDDCVVQQDNECNGPDQNKVCKDIQQDDCVVQQDDCVVNKMTV